MPSTHLFWHKESSRTCHRSPETAIHEKGTRYSLPAPVHPPPGLPPGEDSRHRPRAPSRFGPETLLPAHLAGKIIPLTSRTMRSGRIFFLCDVVAAIDHKRCTSSTMITLNLSVQGSSECKPERALRAHGCTASIHL